MIVSFIREKNNNSKKKRKKEEKFTSFSAHASGNRTATSQVVTK
jgi:hypothetical protein